MAMNNQDEELVDKIKAYTDLLWNESNLKELNLLKEELESKNYEVKIWNFKKRIRTAVIYNGYRLY